MLLIESTRRGTCAWFLTWLRSEIEPDVREVPCIFKTTHYSQAFSIIMFLRARSSHVIDTAGGPFSITERRCLTCHTFRSMCILCLHTQSAESVLRRGRARMSDTSPSDMMQMDAHVYLLTLEGVTNRHDIDARSRESGRSVTVKDQIQREQQNCCLSLHLNDLPRCTALHACSLLHTISA